MARFLDDKRVGKAIRDVMTGDNVRCAVEFWGDGAGKVLFGPSKRTQLARIICDLTMGGTNPSELELLGAPKNSNLKHIRGLHAKLYLSNLGLVVASANASNRGIGFVDVAAHTECGTFHRPGSKAFRNAATWFEQLWLKAHDVDEDAVTDAQRAWARRLGVSTPLGVSLAESNTALRRIASDPDAYRGIGVVFTSGEAEDKDVAEASKIAIAADDARPEQILSESARELLRAWPKGHLFVGWSDEEVSAWPKTFLCAHRGAKGAVTFWCYERFADVCLGGDEWSIFALPSQPVRKRLGLSGRHREAARPDDELLRKIFAYLDSWTEGGEGVAHRLCESAGHLAQLLDEIS